MLRPLPVDSFTASSKYEKSLIISSLVVESVIITLLAINFLAKLLTSGLRFDIQFLTAEFID